MHHKRRYILAASLLFTLPVFAADKAKKTSATTPSAVAAPAQAAVEAIDLNMYQKIREEGLNRSHVMEYASALVDDIGPRLTGSPNMKKANDWTKDQLTSLGCVNAHLEDWGAFGLGWQQLNTWVRMTAPDTAVFIAQATPWSPGTNGAVTGSAIYVDIQDEKDFDKYKGKLAGKIVMLGEMREVAPVDKPLFFRYDEKSLAETAQYPLDMPNFRFDMAARMKRMQLLDKLASFLAEEKAAAVIRPSRDGKNSGGSGGTIFDDNGAALGTRPYMKDKAVKVPVLVMAIENYGRVYRLLQANVPVSLEVNVDVKFTGDQEHAYNTIAEIPGTDPKLKDEVVMIGAHLDSWASATGATDNGAGSAIALEVMRILKALDVKPRRTIRVALWSGEEQGIFGSRAYVRQHFGGAPLSTDPEQQKLPEFARQAKGTVELKPEQKLISGYFNIDNGTGRLRGVYLQGNSAVEPIFEQWIAPIKDLGITTLTKRNTGGTDHLSFDAMGIPGFQFIQDEMDYGSRTHHSNMDTYERLQPADLKQAATVEAIFVYNTAMRDQMLPRKPLSLETEERGAKPLSNLFPGAVSPEKK